MTPVRFFVCLLSTGRCRRRRQRFLAFASRWAVAGTVGGRMLATFAFRPPSARAKGASGMWYPFVGCLRGGGPAGWVLRYALRADRKIFAGGSGCGARSDAVGLCSAVMSLFGRFRRGADGSVSCRQGPSARREERNGKRTKCEEAWLPGVGQGVCTVFRGRRSRFGAFVTSSGRCVRRESGEEWE